MGHESGAGIYETFTPLGYLPYGSPLLLLPVQQET